MCMRRLAILRCPLAFALQRYNIEAPFVKSFPNFFFAFLTKKNDASRHLLLATA